MLNQIQATASFIVAFINIGSLVLFVFEWYRSKNQYGDMKYFFLAILFCVLGAAGFYFNGILPYSLNAIFTMASLGYYCFSLIGFQKFFKHKLSLFLFIIFAAIWAMLGVYMYQTQNAIAFYVVGACFFMVIVYELISVMLHQYKSRQMRKIVVLLMISYITQFVSLVHSTIAVKSIENLQFMGMQQNYLALIMPFSKAFTLFLIVHMTAVRRRANTEIHDKMIKNVFSHSTEGIVITDVYGNFLRINNRFCKMTGHAKRELFAMNAVDSVHNEDREKLIDTFKYIRSSDTGNCPDEMELRIQKKDGKAMWAFISCALVNDFDGSSRYCIWNILDISEPKMRIAELKASEENLRIANREAQHMSRVKSDFLALVSHETRTPLTTMLGITHLLKQSSLSESQMELVGEIENAGNNLLCQLNEMLDISKIESGKQSIESIPFNFAEDIKNVLAMYKTKAEALGNAFYYDICNSIPTFLVGDSMRITQILSNILGNSIKFTNKGQISVAVNMLGRTCDYVDLKFVIRDTGIGMSDEQLDKLFKPFEQADSTISRRYGGTGLGMVISKELIELMGGRIRVESKLGEGTIFIINIPLIIASRGENIGIPQKSDDISTELSLKLNGKRVLLAEDHAINQQIICSILKYYGLQVDSADNGAEALDMLNSRLYDLILMDVQMPVMDGLSATRKIRSMKENANCTVPIIAMTAQAMQRDIQMGMDAGMSGYLTKPVDIKMLEQALMKHLVCEAAVDEAFSHMPAEAKDMPIDARIGLMRFRSNKRLYKESIDEFAAYGSSDEQIVKMINEKNYDEAKILSHSIKGIAANLSFIRLFKSAQRLEKKIGADRENVGDEITDFSRQLREVISGIESGRFYKIIDEV